MPLATYPHCNYTTPTVNTSGSGIRILSVNYTDRMGDATVLGASGTGTISDAITFLGNNLQAYGTWKIVSNSFQVNLSENNVSSMQYSRNGVVSNVSVSQVGGSCVDLPSYEETQSVNAGSVNSITEANIHEWAVMEIVVLACVVVVLTFSILIKKL